MVIATTWIASDFHWILGIDDPWTKFVWLPAGVALGFTLAYGYRLWPGVLLGLMMASASNHLPVTNVLINALSGTLEVLTAYYMLNKIAEFDLSLRRLRDLFSLMNTVIITPLIGAGIAVSLLVFAGIHDQVTVLSQFAHAWQKNTLSYLLITPAILSIFYYEPLRWNKLKIFEALFLSFLVVLVCSVVFFEVIDIPKSFILQPKSFMLFPMVMWAAVSFHQRGAAISILFVAFAAMIGGLNHVGLYGYDFYREDLVNYWLFVLMVSVTGGVLSSLNVGRMRSEEKLKSQLNLYNTLIHAQSDAGEGVVVIEKGKIVYANDALWKIGGYEPGDIPLGSDFMMLIHPSDRKRIAEMNHMRLLGFAQPSRYEALGLAKKGHPVPVEIASANYRDDSERIVTLVIDITERKKAEEALAKSQEDYKELVESVQAIVWKADPYGNFTFVSHEAETLLGYRLSEWTTKEDFWKQIIYPDDRNWACEHFHNESLKLQSFIFDYRVIAADGRIVWLQHMVKVIPNRSGFRPQELVGVMLDISERKKAEAGLRLSRQVFENTAEGILITDANFHVLEANLAYTKITGYQKDEIVGRPLKVLSAGLHDRKYYDSIWHRIETQGQWVGEIWNLRKNGEKYPEWLSISTAKDAKGVVQNYVAVFSDISQRKRSEERLQFLANHDALTRLPNRALLHEKGELAVVRAQRNQTKLAILFIDLDRFKIINDTLGHQTGDVLLQEVAKRLQSCLRESDVVARQGGDEFVVMIEDFADEQFLADVARKIMSVLSHPFVLMNQELYVTASIGISIFPDDGVDIFSLLKHADVAMYRAKENGKNTFHFYAADSNFHSVALLELENSLRRALERNEFVLHYQPKVDLRTQKIVGAEALLRWQHLDLGLLSPSQFIKLAEETGLVIDIGGWVLREACREAVAWQTLSEEPIRVAVNLSARQFRESNLNQHIAEALADSGLTPDCLELEITESMIMQNVEHAISLLQHFRALGTHVLIDDFGTGYSSLGYLKQFPIDSLKIDSSFVRDIPQDSDDMAITQAIIAMAHSLHIKVIAEGVENKEQLDFLKEQECDQIQGFIFSQPLPAQEFSLLLKSQPIRKWQLLNSSLTLASSA